MGQELTGASVCVRQRESTTALRPKALDLIQHEDYCSDIGCSLSGDGYVNLDCLFSFICLCNDKISKSHLLSVLVCESRDIIYIFVAISIHFIVGTAFSNSQILAVLGLQRYLVRNNPYWSTAIGHPKLLIFTKIILSLYLYSCLYSER